MSSHSEARAVTSEHMYRVASSVEVNWKTEWGKVLHVHPQ